MTPVRITLLTSALLAATGCLGASEQAARGPVPPSSATATVASAVADSSGSPSGAAASGTLPDTTGVTPDSLLPKQAYEGIVGWLALGIRHPSFKAGDIVNGKTITERTVVVDSGIAIFPVDDAWRNVRRGTPLVFVGAAGEKSILYADGQAAWEGSGDATVLRVRAPLIPDAVGWLVPRNRVSDITPLPIRESISADGNTRTWTAGDYRIRIQRTGKLEADVIAETHGLAAKRRDRARINHEADSLMGVESDTILDLRTNAHLPQFLAAYQFASSASTLFIFLEEGYECVNFRVVVFRPSRIDWIEEPHYTGQCTR